MLVPVAEAGLRINSQNQQIKSMHLNKLSRLAITLSLGTFVQVVSTPKIVQAQIKPSVFKLSEQPNPPTSGQENPPVTDKPDERVAASTRQQPDPSNIERPPVDAVPPVELQPDIAIHGCSMCFGVILKEDPIDTTAIVTRDSIYTSRNSACSSGGGGSISLVAGDIVITTETLNATTDPIDCPEENSYWKLFKERSPVRSDIGSQ